MWNRKKKSKGTFIVTCGGKTSKLIPHDADIKTFGRKTKKLILKASK